MVASKVLMEKETGKTYLVNNPEEDFYTGSDCVMKGQLINNNIVVVSKKGKLFLVLEPKLADLWPLLRRGPQVMIHKDIGQILARTGLNSHSEVVDAGGGSGSLCLFLANICRKVTVYENNPHHLEILKHNVDKCGFPNVIIKPQNIYEGIKELQLDLITLDLPEPWRVTRLAESALKLGGHLVVYLPNLLQVQEFVNSTSGTAIIVGDIIELLERKWKVSGKIMRPEFEMLGHTGFLAFCRRFSGL